MKWRKLLFLLILFLLFPAFGAVRFIGIFTAPAWEWDEGVYAKIAEHLFTSGQLMTKNDLLHPAEIYLYHPPFHFYLLSAWFHVTSYFHLAAPGVDSARLLAACMSLLTLALLAFFFSSQLKLGFWSLIPLCLVGFDGWLVYTARVSWIENTLMVFGILGLVLYQQALASRKTRYFILAGLLLGLAAIYKHLGAYFIVTVLISLFILKTERRNHILLVSLFAAVIVAYLALMFIFYKDIFFQQTFVVQLRRTFGFQQARGNPTSITVYIQALFQQYRIFAGTVAMVLLSVGLMVYELFVWIRRKSTARFRSHVVLFAWLVSSVVCFGIISLRMPHYFIMLFIPMISYLGYRIAILLQGRVSSVASVAVAPAISTDNSFVVSRLSMAEIVAQRVYEKNLEHKPEQEGVQVGTQASLEPQAETDGTVVPRLSMAEAVAQRVYQESLQGQREAEEVSPGAQVSLDHHTDETAFPDVQSGEEDLPPEEDVSEKPTKLDLVAIEKPDQPLDEQEETATSTTEISEVPTSLDVPASPKSRKPSLWLRAACVVLLISALLLDIYAMQARLVQHYPDALRDVAHYINTSIPGDDIVLTEESIGVLINQRYCRLTQADSSTCRFSWVVLYLSTTQKPPQVDCLQEALQPQYAREVAVFYGFKENIHVYHVLYSFRCSSYSQ